MRITRGYVCPFWVAMLLICKLLNPGSALADDIKNIDDTVFGDGMTYVPPADLTGWFFDPSGPAADPVQSDPSQIWTSVANIATLNEWLSIVAGLGDDSASASNGAVDGDALALTQTVGEQTTQGSEAAPEPLTAGLLIAGLALVAGYAAVRMRRICGRLR